MMDLMGKQNICTGFLESGQSEFRERSKIINIELVHGCVRGDGVMCHYGRVCVCVFCDSVALKLQRWIRCVFKKSGIVLC